VSQYDIYIVNLPTRGSEIKKAGKAAPRVIDGIKTVIHEMLIA